MQSLCTEYVRVLDCALDFDYIVAVLDIKSGVVLIALTPTWPRRVSLLEHLISI